MKKNAETIVLVPGLGFGGFETSLLGYRLGRRGYRVVTFFHFPWRGSLADKASALHAKVEAIGSPTVHYVGHSMGGLIIIRMLLHPAIRSRGRIVLLGSPVNGSVAARKLAGSRIGRWLLGNCMMDARNGFSALPADREAGAIAGRLDIGVGWFIGVEKPCDGVVRVSEAVHADLRDRRVIPVSHSGMLLSRRVVNLVTAFIRDGAFDAG